MRVSLATTGLMALCLAGCGGAKDSESQTATADTPAYSVEPPTESTSANSTSSITTADIDPLAPRSSGSTGEVQSPPDISPDTAPDVAFGYRYSFGLAADEIAPVQQRHARLCEELGAERCQVTGINYRRSNEDDVQAELRLALDPALAHRFGERVLDSVREADGKLVDSSVTGEDVGSGIRTNTRTIANLEEELDELQGRIARGGSAATLQNLRAEAEALRTRIRTLRDDRSQSRERLANTPMVLTYGSGAYVTGNPDFGGAISAAWDQAKWLAYGLFVVLMVLAPWLAAAGLIWLLVRRRRRAEDASSAPAA